MRRTVRIGMTGALAALTLFGGASAAIAASGDVIAQGTCTQGSTWKVKAGVDNGALQVEFEVDSNIVGQTWGVRLSDNGTVFFQGIRQTTAPSGSFQVRRFTANQAGTDTVVALAKNPDTSEICRGTVTV